MNQSSFPRLIIFLVVTKKTVKKTDYLKVSVCSFQPASYGLDINEVAVLGRLPQGLDPLQFAAVKREA